MSILNQASEANTAEKQSHQIEGEQAWEFFFNKALSPPMKKKELYLTPVTMSLCYAQLPTSNSVCLSTTYNYGYGTIKITE